jgi:hypothetical protein
MRHEFLFFLVLSVIAGAGCAGNSVRGAPELEPDEVIARIDELDSRPDWLIESKPFHIEDEQVISLGQTEIPADHRLDAAYRIAQNNAEAAVAGAIERKLEFIFQNAEEGTAMDATRTRFIGAEISRLVASSIRPGRRYWERVAYSTDAGRRLTKYRVYATVQMPEADFRQAIVDALRRNSGRLGLSAEFAEKVDRQWDRLTEPDRVMEVETE